MPRIHSVPVKCRLRGSARSQMGRKRVEGFEMSIPVTFTGNVATEVKSLATASGRQVAVFRLAVPDRRWIKGKGWVDGDPTFLAVSVFGQLAANVTSSVKRGEPVVVVGRLRMSTWQKALDGGATSSGQSLEVEASHVGHDLMRGVTTFARPVVLIEPEDEAAAIAEGLLRQAEQEGFSGGDVLAEKVA